MRARFMNGNWVFSKPIGYHNERVAGPGRILVRNEPVASIIAKALEGYACVRAASTTSTDAGTKKACRHNQYFGVPAAQVHMKRREGGIIWHTQGSGKSLTMVWLTKLVREQVDDARVLIITDRTELDEQIAKVFKGVNEEIVRTKNEKFEQVEDLRLQLDAVAGAAQLALAGVQRTILEQIDHRAAPIGRSEGAQPTPARPASAENQNPVGKGSRTAQSPSSPTRTCSKLDRAGSNNQNIHIHSSRNSAYVNKYEKI
jgi:hypothetical protein